MGKVLIKDTTLTDIANAIRTKDGSTAKMYPREMAGKIGALPDKQKRLIPTKLVCFSKYAETFTGKGIVYGSNDFHRCSVDGVPFTSKVTTAIGDGRKYYLYTPFERECKVSEEVRNRYSTFIVLSGNYSNIELLGNPKEIHSLYNGSGFSITGKGYARIYTLNVDEEFGRIGSIVVDGKTINSDWAGINYLNEFRIDFDKSFNIAKSSTVNSQTQVYVDCFIY